MLIPARSLASGTASDGYCYETLLVEQPRPFVFHVQMNRPDKMNALNVPMWRDIRHCFDTLSDDGDCRAIVFSGNGKIFSSGLDLSMLTDMAGDMAAAGDVARRGAVVGKQLRECQQSVSSLELCAKPVLGAVHSACVGAGFDLLTAADIR